MDKPVYVCFCIGGEEVTQIKNFPVPQIGEHICVRTSRDEDGNYVNPDGRARRVRISGTVTSVDWIYEERGSCSQDWYEVLFARCNISPDESEE